MTIYFCCDELRRNAVRAHPTQNGIDFLEVEDDQAVLLVTLLKPPAAPLAADNVRIEGGEAVRDIRVVGVSTSGSVLTVVVNTPGDFSLYTLRLVTTATSDDPPPDFDPMLSAVDFSFKVNCDTDFDCRDNDDCPPSVFDEPALDYLARDFNSLRQVMLDRIRALAPDWREDHLADLLQTMVDLKAYVGDYQHYQLDAINTEAYLFTARSRVSVRRHARLVDYRMHDGCSARVWVHFSIDPAVTAGVSLPPRTQVFTQVPGQARRIEAGTPEYREALESAPEVFETMHQATLFSAHNFMCFYTWGDARCILPRGATKATLEGHFPNLGPGDVLIFEEVRGAITGDPADADPTKRFAVRLAGTSLREDPLTGTEVTDITWHPDDALPFPLCLSSDAPADLVADCGDAISVARGNIVLADHGRTLPVEDLGTVPPSTLFFVTPTNRCKPNGPKAVPPRFRPQLRNSPVSRHPVYEHDEVATSPKPHSAASVMWLDPAESLPAISLAHAQDFSGVHWTPLRDLLNSAPDSREFVLEVDNDNTARIRFGDDENAKRPNAGERFFALYRVGDYLSGNIGADTLGHIVTNQTAILSVRNPLPGRGGVAPESIETVRQNAPQAFQVQKRAVTPKDYEEIALRYPGVQRAAATIRWTGSWYTVFLTVDRLGGAAVKEEFERDFRAYMNAFRMMGYDLEVDEPEYVPLEIALEVCVEPGYFRASVREALLLVLSARALPNGTKGLFHPDNLTFGQTVYLSRIYAAVQTVPGVESVAVTLFQVQDQPLRNGLTNGKDKIEMGRLEIAQMENNPSFPKHGVVRLTLKGGK